MFVALLFFCAVASATDDERPVSRRDLETLAALVEQQREIIAAQNERIASLYCCDLGW